MSKQEIPNSAIGKAAYLYLSTLGMLEKMEVLFNYFDKEQIKRLKTAATHIDKSMEKFISAMDINTFKQMQFYLKSHEVVMIPKLDKIKHIKKLQSVEHLIGLREAISKSGCDACTEDPEKCRTKKLLEACGTPHYWDEESIAMLDKEDKKIARHCGYCGGFKKSPKEEIEEIKKLLTEYKEDDKKLSEKKESVDYGCGCC